MLAVFICATTECSLIFFYLFDTDVFLLLFFFLLRYLVSKVKRVSSLLREDDCFNTTIRQLRLTTFSRWVRSKMGMRHSQQSRLNLWPMPNYLSYLGNTPFQGSPAKSSLIITPCTAHRPCHFCPLTKLMPTAEARPSI